MFQIRLGMERTASYKCGDHVVRRHIVRGPSSLNYNSAIKIIPKSVYLNLLAAYKAMQCSNILNIYIQMYQKPAYITF
jgi:hypothetical protein